MRTKKTNRSGAVSGSDRVIEILMLAVVLIIVLLVLYYVVIASVSDPYEVYAGKHFCCPLNLRWKDTRRCFRSNLSPEGISTVSCTPSWEPLFPLHWLLVQLTLFPGRRCPVGKPL